MLLTHLGSDNLFGVSAMLQRKALGNIHPQLGYLFMNSIDKLPSSPPENGEKKPSLCINLAEEGSKLVDYAKQMGLSPYPCLRQATGTQITPINSYLVEFLPLNYCYNKTTLLIKQYALILFLFRVK